MSSGAVSNPLSNDGGSRSASPPSPAMRVDGQHDADAPPPSSIGLSLDFWVRLCTRDCWLVWGVLWVASVLGFGAVFVFEFLLGVCAQTESECEWTANFCVDVLTYVFTMINLWALPGRLARMYSLTLENASMGRFDYLGRKVPRGDWNSLVQVSYDPGMYYTFPRDKRLQIAWLLVVSAFAQFANQVFHLEYRTYNTAFEEMPGVLWCNLFFSLSVLTVVPAVLIEAVAEERVRRESPGVYPNTLTMVLLERAKGCLAQCGCIKERATNQLPTL